jgi:hypothetical protein
MLSKKTTQFSKIKKTFTLFNVHKEYRVLLIAAFILIISAVWLKPDEQSNHTNTVERIINDAEHDLKLRWLKKLATGQSITVSAKWGLASYEVSPLNTGEVKFEDSDRIKSICSYSATTFGIVQAGPSVLIRTSGQDDTIPGLEGYSIRGSIYTSQKDFIYLKGLDNAYNPVILKIGEQTVTKLYSGKYEVDEDFDYTSIDDQYIYQSKNVQTSKGFETFLYKKKLYRSYSEWSKNSEDARDSISFIYQDQVMNCRIFFLEAHTLYCVATLAEDTALKVFSLNSDKTWRYIRIISSHSGFSQNQYISPYLFLFFRDTVPRLYRDNPTINGPLYASSIYYARTFIPIGFYAWNDSLIQITSNSNKTILYVLPPTKDKSSSRAKELFNSDTIQTQPFSYNFTSEGVSYIFINNQKWYFTYTTYDGKTGFRRMLPEGYYTTMLDFAPGKQKICYGIIGNCIGLVRLSEDGKGGLKEQLIYNSWPEYPFTVKESINQLLVVVMTIAYVLVTFLAFVIVRDRREKMTMTKLVSKEFMPVLVRRFEALELEMEKLQGRSDWMLFMGIIIACFGIFVYLIMFSISRDDILKIGENSIVDVLIISRPIVLMLFIETLALFFLRQYRIIFNEYKDFYAVYMRLQKLLQIADIYMNHHEESMKKKALDDFFDIIKNETITFSQSHTDNSMVDPELMKTLTEMKTLLENIKAKWK